MGLSPAWRNSLAYVNFGTSWEDGASLAEIDAVRQLLIRSMKILEAIAPDSGAYFNEVRAPHTHTMIQVLSLTFSPSRTPIGIPT